MERIPEAELMLEADQAQAYASQDWSEAHDRFVTLLSQHLPGLPEQGIALDLGCGSADISLRFARVCPQWRVHGLDGSPAMLDQGRQAVRAASLESRVGLFESYLPAASLPAPGYALVFSNSLLHHLEEPRVLWRAMRQAALAGAGLFAMDLLRPESPEEVATLVDRHLPDAPPVLRGDFECSLYAAYREVEVREQLAETGLGDLQVEAVSDRHWIAWGYAPA